MTLTLKEAFSESDVLGFVRQRLREWPPEELARLPEQCRPGNVTDTNELVELAFNLATARIDSTWPQQVLVELDALFSQASQRLAQIQTLSPQHLRPRPKEE